MQKPETRKQVEHDEIHGVTIPDPYRWLENADDPLVQEWTDTQNEYTFSLLKNKRCQIFSDELARNYEATEFVNFFGVKGRYFYRERRSGEDQFSLYVKEGLDGELKKLVDPGSAREDGTVTIDYWDISSTGKYILYGLSQGGDEMATLYIQDVDTGTVLPEKIVNCRYSNTAWLSDDSGFFYTRNPRPGDVPDNDLSLYSRVFFHKLGDDPTEDKMIFGEGRPKDDMIHITLSEDDKHLAIHAAQNWTQNEIHVYSRDEDKVRSLLTGISSKFSLRFLKDKAIVHTNYKANNYRVLSAPMEELFTPIDEWTEFIPEREHLLERISVSEDKILAEYVVNASSQVQTFDHKGNALGDLPLPLYSSVMGISARADEKEFFFGVSSFTFPRILYRYNPQNDSCEVIRKTDNPIDPDEYEIRQEWSRSQDGTSVPMFIFHKKDIAPDVSHPTILYGYGGFGMGITPYFMKNWIPWIERGGIFAVANIRGGNEFGKKWHTSGTKKKKQNTFNDFIAAAEHLIAQNYTTPAQLGIVGGSNGGLLVSAVAMQRPELFNAVGSLVPLTDMVRFPQFGMAMRWVHEYGDPQVKEDLESILQWSPYHNAREGTKYPHFLFTTAEKDTRVDPLHARKMTALLQSIEQESDILLFTDKEAGHGPGKPIRKIVESQALLLSFFSKNLDKSVHV